MFSLSFFFSPLWSCPYSGAVRILSWELQSLSICSLLMASKAAHMVNPEAVTCLYSHPCPRTQNSRIKFCRGLGSGSLGPRSNLLSVCCFLTSTGLLCFPSSSLALKIYLSTSYISTFCPYLPHIHEYVLLIPTPHTCIWMRPLTSNASPSNWWLL